MKSTVSSHPGRGARKALPGPFLLLMDYDGTLLPLKRHIHQSYLPVATRRLLARLANRHQVVLVTGRDLGDLRRIAGPLRGIGKVGTHGLEVEGLPGLRLASPTRLKRLERDAAGISKAVTSAYGRTPGVHVQVKRYALSLHYARDLAGKKGERNFRAGFRRLVRRHGTAGLWQFQGGKAMIDLRPRGFSKANAVRALKRLFPTHPVLFAGDDLSDLPALKAVGKRGIRIGIGRVVPRKACDLWFPTPGSFTGWLKRMAR